VKICSDICPWTLSVPRSSQFSSSFALGKLFEHIFAPSEGYCLYICKVGKRDSYWRNAEFINFYKATLVFLLVLHHNDGKEVMGCK